jgi:ABC-2 type transport system ATP-binding protein
VGNNPVIDVRHVKRTFDRGRVLALDDVSFTVGPGEIIAVLGANGAGKTTLVKVLATLLRPSAGTVRVAGHDVVTGGPAVRAAISVVFGGDRGLYGRLSARDNLRFFGALKGEDVRTLGARAGEILGTVGLADRAKDRVETFSRGMKQRLHLAIGMLGHPELLMLDEPTIGLDVVEARRIRETVSSLAHGGTTILLTSHNVADIDHLAARVLMIRAGRLESDQAMADFRRRSEAVATIVVDGSGPAPDLAALALRIGAPVEDRTIARADAQWSVSVKVREWTPRLLADVGRALEDCRLVDMRVTPVGLDSVVEAVLTSAGS